jgi:UDP-N-acetylmuramoyl-tripeptide--D-alanyl-D-alanine ligase
MPEFRPGELAQWLSGTWKNGVPEGRITGVTQDTRTLQPGDLYVAIRGDRFDGHDFLGQAFERGAAGALINHDCDWLENPVLAVPDPIAALQDLSMGYRRKWTGTVVGITGSVGKTTVKEMCADVLSMSGETHRTVGNYNNHIGLPLTMLSMPANAPYGVFEIGMNQPGEIGLLSSMLEPGIGIVTDVGSAHRGSFESVEAIAREKARLAEQVAEDGLVILDVDGEWFDVLRRNVRARIVTISLGGDAEYTGRPSSSGTMIVGDYEYSMPQPGEHMMRNALRAIALGLEVGMAPGDIAAGGAKFKAPPMRWETSEVEGITFINDAYNANPLSMRANLKTFAGQPVKGKKWVVIGGMLELGDTAEEEHVALGRFIDTLALDGVITVGELGRLVECRSGGAIYHCDEPGEASRILRDNLFANDHVLLKASRGEHLEKVLKYFKES